MKATFEEQFPSLQRLGKIHYLCDTELDMIGISNVAILNCLGGKNSVIFLITEPLPAASLPSKTSTTF